MKLVCKGIGLVEASPFVIEGDIFVTLTNFFDVFKRLFKAFVIPLYSSYFIIPL